MRKVAIVGAGMMPFGKSPDRTVSDLGREAATRALRDAGLGAAKVEAVWCGSVFGGMLVGQRIMKQLGATGMPVHNVENACSSGSTALREAWWSVASGLCDIALVVGVEKLSALGGGTLPLEAEDHEVSTGMVMPAVYAMRARRYMHEYGLTERDLAAVSVKNHRHGSLNPYAQHRNTCTVEEVLGSRMIATPLTLLQCCPSGDGAAALVLAEPHRARRLTTCPVWIEASVLRSGRFENGFRDMTQSELSNVTISEAYQMAGVSPSDVNVAEVHDAFTIAEVMYYESLGLCPVGDGVRLVRDGDTALGGRVPVNPSGGLLCRGHPLGATGVAQVAELTWQLRGQAGDRQVEGARVAVSQCTGGGIAGFDHGACTVHVLAC